QAGDRRPPRGKGVGYGDVRIVGHERRKRRAHRAWVDPEKPMRPSTHAHELAEGGTQRSRGLGKRLLGAHGRAFLETWGPMTRRHRWSACSWPRAGWLATSSHVWRASETSTPSRSTAARKTDSRNGA